MMPLIQFILAAPVLIFAPFAWIPLVAAFDTNDSGTLLGRIFAFYWGVAGICGLVALIASILYPASEVRKKQKIWVFMTVGLLLGLSLAVLVLIAPLASGSVSSYDWFGIWTFGGPAFVAGWNLWRFWKIKNEPNNAVETTPVDVTDAAAAASAPSTSVSHLWR